MVNWGIDLGGTKIEGIVLSSPAGKDQPLARLRLPTEADRGYEHILERVKELVEGLTAASGCRPAIIGLGHPGAEEPRTGRLKNSNTICLNGRRLRLDLEALLACPIAAANDANCFALAEARFGAAKDAEVAFGVIMGTGVGGGVVVNGRVLHGAQGIAGEWGHNILDDRGPQCYCGRRGCVEKFISGPALEDYYYSLTGQRRGLAEIGERASAGADPHAQQVIDRLCRMFGRAIAVVINILDPDCIVLGGGVSNIDALYTQGKEETVKYVFSNGFETRLVKHSLGDSAGVFGAALLADAHSS